MKDTNQQQSGCDCLHIYGIIIFFVCLVSGYLYYLYLVNLTRTGKSNYNLGIQYNTQGKDNFSPDFKQNLDNQSSNVINSDDKMNTTNCKLMKPIKLFDNYKDFSIQKDSNLGVNLGRNLDGNMSKIPISAVVPFDEVNLYNNYSPITSIRGEKSDINK